MILNDQQIIKLCEEQDMISPYERSQIRLVAGLKTVSYGLSSFGYDIRLSGKEFYTFRHIPGTIVDPKNFNPHNLSVSPLLHDEHGNYFVIPANSYGLGVAIEKLQIPKDVSVICMGKSTYARCGIIANITPAEAGWKGHLTLEFSNSSSADCRIYANEGVVQLLFLQGKECETSYSDRNGKYQDQPETVIVPRM
ncbi:dCTP deaminase [Nostoc phage N1]|nr:dCTP deaminase [Nostoc phage N1]